MAFKQVNGPNQSAYPDAEKYVFEDKGQALTGRLVHRAEISTEYGPKQKYVISTSEGNKSILGSFQLDERMSLVTDNAMVRITFLGREKTSSGGKVKLFTVEVDDES